MPFRLVRNLHNSGTTGRYPWQQCMREPLLTPMPTGTVTLKKASAENTYLVLTLTYTNDHDSWRDRSKNLPRFAKKRATEKKHSKVGDPQRATQDK